VPCPIVCRAAWWRSLRSTLGRGVVEIAVTEIKALLLATLPHLATKAELADLRMEMVAGFADKPGKTYMWGILAVLLTAYACGLAGLTILK